VIAAVVERPVDPMNQREFGAVAIAAFVDGRYREGFRMPARHDRIDLVL
jgi:hypothetical protein